MVSCKRIYIKEYDKSLSESVRYQFRKGRALDIFDGRLYILFTFIVYNAVFVQIETCTERCI